MCNFSFSIEHIPHLPGVYIMKNDSGVVLYIGKAIDLKKRVSQYFLPGRDERLMVPSLISEIATIESIIVDSEKEALLLERQLIREYLPKYNVYLKDDSSFYLFHIDPKEAWPKLTLVRGKDQFSPNALLWGPYSDTKMAKEILDLLHTIFPLRRCSNEEFLHRKTPCLYYQIKKCPAPCVQFCSREQYQGHVDAVINFLDGKIETVLIRLQQEMARAVKDLEFEHAAYLRDLSARIVTWKNFQGHTVDAKCDLSVDLFGLAIRKNTVVITRAEYRAGRLMGMDHVIMKQVLGSEEEILSAWILQYYTGNTIRHFVEAVVLCFHQVYDHKPLEECLSESLKKPIQVLFPDKEPLQSWSRLLLMNAQTKLNTVSGDTPEATLKQLQEFCGLTTLPHTIDCIDHSHFQGSDSVSAVVCVENGNYNRKKNFYYKWGKTLGNDLFLLKSLIKKRYAQEKYAPDLILIDGGEVHWKIAIECLKNLNRNLVVLCISKESGKHTKGLVQEKLWGKLDEFPKLLPSMHPCTLFLQKVRDETHKLALSCQKRERKKSHTRSILDDVPGIGLKRKQKILQQYGSWLQLCKTLIENPDCVSLPRSVKRAILERFHQEEKHQD